MATISEFIQKYYDVVYKASPVEDMENVTDFMLADSHDSFGHSIINSLFINTFANPADYVLVEIVSSMKNIQPNDAVQSTWLTTKAKIAGWDLADSEGFTRIFEDSNLQEAYDLELKIQILIKKITNDSTNETIKSELQSVFLKHMMVLRQGPSKEETLQKVKETFAGRTQSMIQSLSNATELSTRRFVIAGQLHLDPRLKFEKEDFSLTETFHSFFEFLSLRKAVVLVPKEDQVNTLEQERTALISDIYCKAMLDFQLMTGW